MIDDIGPEGGADGRIFVHRGSTPVRRALDPTAWMVLEELAMAGAVPGEAVAVSHTSVRRLAAILGLSKDTVAAAIRRLTVAGLVCRVDERETASGRFGRARYEVDLTSVGLVPAPDDEGTGTAAEDQPTGSTAAQPHGRSTAQRRRHPSSPRRPDEPAQLSLLDPDQTPDQTADDNPHIDHDHPHATPNIPTQAPPPNTTTPTTDDTTATTPKEATRTTNTIATPGGLVPVPARRPSSEGGR